MAFILTKYIFPLEQEIAISKELKYSFDNPRTSEEIELIKTLLIESIQLNNTSLTSENNDLLLRTTFSIGRLKKTLRAQNHEHFASEYYKAEDDTFTIDLLAKTWIVLRFPEDGTFEKCLADKKEMFKHLFTKEGNLYPKHFNSVNNYCHIISLLANDATKYYGNTFIFLNTPAEIFFKVERNTIWRIIESFAGNNNLLEHSNRKKDWEYWIDGKHLVINAGKKLDRLLMLKIEPQTGKNSLLSKRQSPFEKINHVGEILKAINRDPEDIKTNLLLLVSIFEYLLTRNPDANRFNIEDSITKQFILKTAIIIYYDGIFLNLDLIKKNLANAYSYRSDIAHGNFHGDDKIKDYVYSIFFLFLYLRSVINVYLKDMQLLEFLKDN